MIAAIVSFMLVDTAWAQSDRSTPPLAAQLTSNLQLSPIVDGVPVTSIRVEEDLPGLETTMRFQSIDQTDPQSLMTALMMPDAYRKLSGSVFNMGPETRHLMMVVTIRNSGSSSGEWLLTTNRGVLRDFALDEWDGQSLERLIDGQNVEQVKQIVRTYHALTYAIRLDPDEVRTFIISFDPVHSSLVPLEIKTREAMASSIFAKLAITIGSSIGMLTIIIISISIYAVNGRPQFLWMGLAELAHTLFVLHVGGYTTFYFLYGTGNWINAIGFMLPQLFAVAMAQFARSFINTKEDLVWLDRLLRGLIYTGCFLIVVQFVKNYFGDPVYLVVFDILAGVITMTIVLVLPYVAIVATRKLGAYHWPLIVAWGSLCTFVLYGTLVALGLLTTAPYSWHLTGPVGLFQTIFAFWALILYLDQLNQERINNALQLSESLVAQQQISEEAGRLAMENRDALSTIRDQENLIHASGHDSQHVLMALKTIIKFADQFGPEGLQENLPDMLRSSAGHLENIIGTTLANPVAGFQSTNFVSLSTFSIMDLSRSLETIYGPMMRKEQMKLLLRSDDDFMVVSDRALLARILSNLLSNCLKFAKGGDVILSMRTENDRVHITVADSGAGIPDGVIENISNTSAMRIQTASDETGTGFGLLSSWRIATALGGSLEIGTPTNGGAAVTISLPHLLEEDGSKPIALEDLEELLPDYQLIDVDEMRIESDTDFDAALAATLPLLPITFDNSSPMIGRVSRFAALVLIKPVTLAMIRHPLLSELAENYKMNRRDATQTDEPAS